MSEARTSRLLRQEPFRILFPLAVIVTIGGVALWPMLHFGMLTIYPGTMHARVMSAGFAGFLLGFLGTATPRLLDASPLHRWELMVVVLAWLGSVWAYFCSRISTGDGCLAVAMIFFAGAMLLRWKNEAKDTPPPGFPVALAGVLAGGLAAAGLAWRDGAWMGAIDFGFARLMLYQGAFLLPLLGVGPFLLPRFLAQLSPHRFEETLRPPPAWWRRCLVCSLTGFAVVISFALEAAGWARTGMVLRAIAMGGYFLLETPLFRKAKQLTTPATALRIAIGLIVLGSAWAGFDAVRRIGILHLLLVSGTGLAMLAVGVRVILGHAGRHDLLEKRLWWLRVVTGLVVLAAATRVSADFLPRIRLSHLDYAALIWGIVALVWLVKLGRFFFAEEREVDTEPKCPRARRRAARRSRTREEDKRPVSD